MHLAPLHPYPRLEGVAREPQPQLPIVAHPPPKDLVLLCQDDRVRLPTRHLLHKVTLELGDLLGPQHGDPLLLSQTHQEVVGQPQLPPFCAPPRVYLPILRHCDRVQPSTHSHADLVEVDGGGDGDVGLVSGACEASAAPRVQLPAFGDRNGVLVPCREFDNICEEWVQDGLPDDGGSFGAEPQLPLLVHAPPKDDPMDVDDQRVAVPAADLLDDLVPQLQHHPWVQNLQIEVLLVGGGDDVDTELA
mmetsp:Transcript_2106/g.1979  ORF Transcript_2106/g.1979 Transcript_2106/m.1979 type:complete len:247 (-) Transcript_2106:178-918(-)